MIIPLSISADFSGMPKLPTTNVSELSNASGGSIKQRSPLCTKRGIAKYVFSLLSPMILNLIPEQSS